MENKEYQDINVPEIPIPQLLPDERWEMIWRLELETLYASPDDFKSIAEEISDEIQVLMIESFERRHPGSDYPIELNDYELQFDLISTHELNAVIHTGRCLYTDECWILAPFWLFMRIEQMIGHIRLILNTPKEEHFFWRRRRAFFGDKCLV
jgi:hypothetical protein